MEEIINCQNCNLHKNQLPLLDKKKQADVMWVGLSAKKVEDIKKSTPLENNTNSGLIIEMIEKEMKNITFYKTNLVKCLPLNEKNKLRYPTKEEMNSCIKNLIKEISFINPKVILILGRQTYNYIESYIKENNITIANIFYIEHPSYIYIYKRNCINDYIKKIKEILNTIGIK